MSSSNQPLSPTEQVSREKEPELKSWVVESLHSRLNANDLMFDEPTIDSSCRMARIAVPDPAV